MSDAPANTPGPEAEAPHGPVARTLSVIGWIGVATLLLPIVLTCSDIVWRRVVGGAFIDTFDLTKLSLVTAASWAIPYGFIHNSHVSVDLFTERLSPRNQALANIIIHIIAAALFAGLIWLAWQGAMLHYSYGDTTQNLGLPVVWYWAIFIFGLALTEVACIWRVIRAWRLFRILAGKPT